VSQQNNLSSSVSQQIDKLIPASPPQIQIPIPFFIGLAHNAAFGVLGRQFPTAKLLVSVQLDINGKREIFSESNADVDEALLMIDRTKSMFKDIKARQVPQGTAGLEEALTQEEIIIDGEPVADKDSGPAELEL